MLFMSLVLPRTATARAEPWSSAILDSIELSLFDRATSQFYANSKTKIILGYEFRLMELLSGLTIMSFTISHKSHIFIKILECCMKILINGIISEACIVLSPHSYLYRLYVYWAMMMNLIIANGRKVSLLILTRRWIDVMKKKYW